MFIHALKRLPLTDKFASDFFSNIYADSYEGDASFCATLRVLLYNRLQPDEKVNCKLKINITKEKNADVRKKDIERYSDMFSYLSEADSIHINVFQGYTEDDFMLFKSRTNTMLSTFNYLDKESYYLSQSGYKTYVYSYEEHKQTIIFTLKLTYKTWHKMQTAIPKLLPWYFTSPLEDFEKELLYSLTLKDSKEYLNLISLYAKRFNFREDKLRKLLKDFGLSFELNRLEKLREELLQTIEKFTKLQEEISKTITMERELTTDINGLEFAISQGDKSGLVDYFICNKCLHLLNADQETLSYIVTTYFEYFDQSIFESSLNNPASYFYKNTNEFTPVEFKNLLMAIFGDDIKVKVRVCAEFELSLSGTLIAVKHSIHLEEYSQWLSHPHINSFQCLGENRRFINDLMFNRKYIEAIEQTIAATKNINFADPPVVEEFIEKLLKSTKKFLELPSGDVVSSKEAILWLKEKEGINIGEI